MDKTAIAREIRETEDKLAALRRSLTEPEWKPGDEFIFNSGEEWCRYMLLAPKDTDLGRYSYAAVHLDDNGINGRGHVNMWYDTTGWKRV